MGHRGTMLWFIRSSRGTLRLCFVTSVAARGGKPSGLVGKLGVPKLRGEHSRQAASLVGHVRGSDFLPLPPTRHRTGRQHKARGKTNTKDWETPFLRSHESPSLMP